MPPHARSTGGDALASGRARQRLKLAAIAYAGARHGMDADEALGRAALLLLCKAAIEFVDTLPGSVRRRMDLLLQVDTETLQLAAIAYYGARHGVDADVGMAREGLALLCQTAIQYVESLPKEEAAKRAVGTHLQIGSGA